MDIIQLREKANSLPAVPGVYIMKDAGGEVIYVGKSKKLKNRVTSYFVGSSHSVKTARMVSRVSDFDYIVCKTEIEALTLENVLIKRHSPKYNIKLKDAKSYPYIKVTSEEYPKLFVTRSRSSDKARYFGPYSGSAQAHSALEAVMAIFKLACCKRSFPKDIGRGRPCIYRDIGRCIAPCAGGVSSEEYRELVRGACRVLDGNSSEAKEEIYRDMMAASEEMEFERAAMLRDRLAALDKLSEKQKVVADSKVNRDVFNVYISDSASALAVLTIRDGALINKNEFLLSSVTQPTGEELVSLVASHYDALGVAPREIMLGFEVTEEDAALLSEYLSISAGYKVMVKLPERGDGRALCDMAYENAKESARQRLLDSERDDKNIVRLAELMGLSEIPERIEAYDISNIGNESIVASMVVWHKGRLKKSDYRLFSIKSTDGADDYGSMREALTRRLSHIGDGTLSLGERPDLLLIDGGDAHVGVAKEVLEALNLEISAFGMVKDDYHKTRALTDGEREISIAKEFDVYAFIYNLQEEAHRFAVKNSQKSKIKTMTTSSLEKIEGIGPKKARALLSELPFSRIRSAGVEELMAVKGIGRSDAERIHAYFADKKKRGTKK
ncbi:MAG: excinuclease ABC subunit UvrC [Clostridia bacterium]|nr:excinuclease ABC subunit UvrC [Clostridia bacterium]